MRVVMIFLILSFYGPLSAQIDFDKWADVLLAAADTTSNVGKALDLIEHQIVDSKEVELAEDRLAIVKLRAKEARWLKIAERRETKLDKFRRRQEKKAYFRAAKNIKE